MGEALAVVLAGGQGTRLRRVLPDLPKPLAPVAGKPFVEWLLRYLRKQGVSRAILSAGHLASQVEQYAAGVSIPGLHVRCVREEEPLGTAGGFLFAIRTAGELPECVLACNGDSLALADLGPLIGALRGCDAALLGVRVADAGRFGTLGVDPQGMLTGFQEKRPGAGLINAGVYAFAREAIARFPGGKPLSFEYDVFPKMVEQGARIRVSACAAPFLDIGTEQTLEQAGEFVRANREWFE